MAGIGIERQSSTPAPPPPPLSLFACCVLVRYEGLLVTAAVAPTMLGTCAPGDVIGPPPYEDSGRALGYDGCDLDSNEDGVVRAPNTGAAADLDFKTGNADFIGMRDFGAAVCTSLASGLAFDSVGWQAVARRLAIPLRAGRATGSLSLSAAKKARCRELRALVVVSGAGGLLWKPSAGCRTGEVELPDKNSGASFW